MGRTRVGCGSWGLWTLLAICAAPCAAQEGAEQRYYTYNRERQPLMVDTTRIAVFREADEVGAPRMAVVPLDQVLAAFDLDTNNLKAHEIHGWTYAPVGAGAPRGQADVEHLAAQVAAAGAVDFVSPVFMDEYGPLLVTRDLLIGFEADVLPAEAERMIVELNLGEILDRDMLGLPGVYRVRSNSRNGLEVLQQSNALWDRAEVRYAEPNLIKTMKLEFIPNDPQFTELWGIHNTGQSGGIADMDMDGVEAWDITLGNTNIVVVVMDTGTQLDHPDLNLRTPGLDPTGNGTDGGPATSCDNHGTAVAGTISGVINNSMLGTGISPLCRVAPAKVLTIAAQSPCPGSGSGSDFGFTSAITWADSSGAHVTNASLSFGPSGTIDTAYTNTHANGVVHFASAGNSGAGSISYPASAPNVNSVAALTRTGAKAGFSQFGPGLDFSAPGQSIRTTDRTGASGYNNGDSVIIDGTSFSSPYAAGVAALIFSFNSNLTATQVDDILDNGCMDLGTAGYDTTYGHGFVNARQSLQITPAPGPPQVFDLSGPAHMATGQTRAPSFSWMRSDQANSYQLLVDDDSSFGGRAPEINISGIGATSFTPTGLPLTSATTYFWKVIASNSEGEITSTSVFSFMTYTTPPGSFSLMAPLDGATGIGVQPTFFWGSAPLGETYTFTLDDNADFSSPLYSTTTASLQHFLPITLSNDTFYYWKVEANNQIGSSPASPASFSFRTIGPLPGAFNLLSPPDGPNISTTTPTLSWSAASLVATYTVQVDDDLLFGSPQINVSGHLSTSYMVPGGILVSGVRYYWRVFAVNENGSTSSSPPSRSFGVLVPDCQGDSNRDGVVDFNDVLATLGAFGAMYPGSSGIGDANFDGVVNFFDVLTVLANFLVDCPE